MSSPGQPPFTCVLYTISVWSGLSHTCPHLRLTAVRGGKYSYSSILHEETEDQNRSVSWHSVTQLKGTDRSRDRPSHWVDIPPSRVQIWRTGPEGLIAGLGFPRAWFSCESPTLTILAPGVTFDFYYSQRVT